MSSELGHSRLSLIEGSLSSHYSSWIRDALDELPDNFLITDPTISGNPIVFASRGFLKMSGYSKEEVLGRNGRIFQGPDTDRRSVSDIREAIRQERPLQLTLLNYRKDGSPFRFFFRMSPVFSRDDWRVTHFVAVQVPISANLSLLRSGSMRNRRNSVEDWSGMKEIVLGSCRREVCLNSVGELRRALPFDSYVDSDNRDKGKHSSRTILYSVYFELQIAFYVGVQVEEGSKNDSQGLSPQMMLLGAVGAVKVAVRSLSMGVGPSKS